MKKTVKAWLAGSLFLVNINQGHAADVNRMISLELDPLAPAAALRESSENRPTSMFGGSADFNLGKISTGPEIWTGVFTRKGATNIDSSCYRIHLNSPECGDAFKLDAVRLRWNVAIWEHPYTMRGWFAKAGYSYTKVQSKGRRDAANLGLSPEGQPLKLGEDSSSALVTDMRQGVDLGFGQRWTFFDNKAVATLALAYTANMQRKVDIESDDEVGARRDYDELIESIPDTHLSVRPMPEVNMGVGLLF